MSEPTHFADAFNFALGVRDFVRPEHLRELDRTEFAKLLADGKSLTIQKFRDVLKECILSAFITGNGKPN